MTTILSTKFDTTNTAVLATAGGAGIKNKIVAIAMHNNETDETKAVHVRLTSGSTAIYGGSSGSIKLSGRGDFFFLPFMFNNNDGEPGVYCETAADTALNLLVGTTGGVRISGICWYIQEA